MTKATASTRHRVLACIRAYPGIHLRAIEREIGVSSALVHYHVKRLEGDGLVTSAAVGGYLRFYPREAGDAEGMRDADRDVLATLRQEVPLQIVLLLLEHGPLTQSALGAHLDLAKSTVSYHVDRLEARGILSRAPEDAPDRVVRLRDAARVKRLLTKYAPTHDLVEKFGELWEDFYG